ncbi:hypothetical protein ADIWIN_0309 [Winogradskyella psychrotolerans RS-3]|uniref:Uncharacterized protein n=1 Tax=Winogradskyella psychrotolerans RS-3 TaxID=641526 RepID=S7VWM2_9FLAO|nr:hypothetical protein [Winogradskyella psychrotolerans]EPR74670.1 hypothetical protein ADIWIN_0309 [Winogradskyella psychrotolerans RS-3]
MKQLLTIVLTFLFFALSAQNNVFKDHAILIADVKGHFVGDVVVSNPMTNSLYDYWEGNPDFLKDFTLKMKVWDFLGEPMEMYAFQWSRKKFYKVMVDGSVRTMSLKELEEYPDLQKRFLDIRPTKVDIKIVGHAGNGEVESYYSVGRVVVPESKIPVEIDFDYTVKDVDLLIAREGEYREPTIAGSPPTWNEFFNWSYKKSYNSVSKIKLNISEASFNKLSKQERDVRIKKIKDLWKQIKHISVNAYLKTLEWPELEMIDIIKTYDRYKNKSKELSPREKIEAELAKLQRTTEYSREDDWGVLPELAEPVLIVNEDGRSIQYANSKNKLFQIEDGRIGRLYGNNDNGYNEALVPYFTVYYYGTQDYNEYYLIDKNGKKLVDKKFSSISYYNSDFEGHKYRDLDGEYFKLTHIDDIKTVKEKQVETVTEVEEFILEEVKETFTRPFIFMIRNLI